MFCSYCDAVLLEDEVCSKCGGCADCCTCYENEGDEDVDLDNQ